VHKPYLEFLGTVGGFKVYQVDGEWLRSREEIEFTNFGSHVDFPDMIPKDEFWLDKEYTPNEQNLFLGHMEVENKLLSEGYGPGEAYSVARKLEKYWRSKQPRKKEVRKKLLGTTVDGKKVWLVDGNAVRSKYDVNFTEGGHHFRYDYIPEDEIWIDDDLVPSERPYVVAHESIEERVMRKYGVPYKRAHEEDADLVELVVRKLGN